MREIVTNTSPLLYLHQLGYIQLLGDLYGTVIVPRGVVDELEAIGPGDVFCIFQGYFDDVESFGAAMGSDIGRQVADDVPNYSPKGAQVFHFAVDG